MPVPLVALVFTTSTSPPHSLGSSSLAARLLVDLRRGSTPGRSILFSATTIGTLGRAGVADRFFGLRHDAVVGRHDQHGDVGHVGAAGPHLGERFVARRIDERDPLAVLLDLSRRGCAA